MGSSQSSMATQFFLTAFVLAGAASVGYLHYTRGAAASAAQATPTADSDAGTSGGKKKQKKKKGPSGAASDDAPAAEKQPAPTVVSFPQVLTVPGEFEPPSSVEDNAASKAKKSKKKKGKKTAGAEGRLAPPAGADELSDSSAGVTPVPPSASAKAKAKRVTPPARAEEPEEERWTRVESRRKVKAKPAQEDVAAGSKPDVPAIDTTAHTGSDAGITTSVTGGSSPVTEDDGSKGGDEILGTSTASLSENPLVAPVRIQPGEKPAKGFTWEDYEGVQVDNHADDEDDGGWGVVKSKGRSKYNQPSAQASVAKAPETMTKKQRQNAAKREAQKAAKEDAEAERKAILAQHQRELERAKIAEQFGQKAKGSKV